MSEPVVAVVVAAGSGSRLGSSTLGGTGYKALRLLDNQPLVLHAVRALAAGGVTCCIVVIPDGSLELFQAALTKATIPVNFVVGGLSRQQSVYRGLAAIDFRSGCRIVLVHDAARPLVPAAVVQRVIAAVQAGAVAVVPAIEMTDSIRSIAQDQTQVVDRAMLRAVQTPQGFAARELLAAHQAAVGAEHTDDAAVCEAAGHHVVVVPGSKMAMKITEPMDFIFAETLLKENHDH